MLQNYYGAAALDFATILDEALKAAEVIRPLLVDVTAMLAHHRKQGDNILFEGAQGTFLDIDHGTYPFVTSSNTTAGAVAIGSGYGPLYLDYVLGVTKAYTTRVGAGPMPTELHDKVGEFLSDRGQEFGATTGRRRRCGWLDIALLRRSVLLNSFSGLGLTKLDVFDGLSKILLCVGYTVKGRFLEMAPSNLEDLKNCEPVYEELPGWEGSCFGVKEFDQLPQNALAYIRRIEELLGVPVVIVTTGPERSETIILEHPFDCKK